mgnify:CR=1 FL=1
MGPALTVRLLLDTHALIWHALMDPHLPRRARAAIDDPATPVFVSAASAWEIATKVRLGKLPGGPLATDFVARVRAEGFRVLSVRAQDAQEAGGLPGHHNDPFDRMLIAQALRRDLVFVSNEERFDEYGVTRLWK